MKPKKVSQSNLCCVHVSSVLFHTWWREPLKKDKLAAVEEPWWSFSRRQWSWHLLCSPVFVINLFLFVSLNFCVLCPLFRLCAARFGRTVWPTRHSPSTPHQTDGGHWEQRYVHSYTLYVSVPHVFLCMFVVAHFLDVCFLQVWMLLVCITVWVLEA